MKRVAVLMGGWSAERAVSLVTGDAVTAALRELGHEVVTIDVTPDLIALIQALTPRPDAVFNALHGPFGEDGTVQGLLDTLAIPYTHSGRRASALAIDKPMAKRLFADAGIRCPEGVTVALGEAARQMPAPYVVKPPYEGSSVGVRIVFEGDNRPPIDAATWPYGEQVMVERYIPGRELTVAVMDDMALGVLEIRPRQGFYDYAAKYTEGKADHLCPAPLPPGIYAEAEHMSLLAHRTLGCRGITRSDLRYDDISGNPGTLYLLEINTQPGMTPLSLVPEIAAHAGYSFTELVNWMVEHAECDR
ncbi:MAG: D-alanine--D-alanine ligase [Alphaproteobacteria bacterium]|nr:D-alanine--D-alanine ligase [Alphaproteobacteria bacterium]